MIVQAQSDMHVCKGVSLRTSASDTSVESSSVLILLCFFNLLSPALCSGPAEMTTAIKCPRVFRG